MQSENTEQTPPQVVLYNGEPRIQVTHYRKLGYYEWATKKTGMMKHSKLSIVDEFMQRYGYQYFIHEDSATDAKDSI